MRLENKVALISGGARGMGAVEAKLFAEEGAKVIIGDMLEDEGRKIEAEINEAGGECVFVSLDVSDEDAWKQAVNEAVSRYGKLDILVNTAGIYRATMWKTLRLMNGTRSWTSTPREGSWAPSSLFRPCEMPEVALL